MYVLSFGNATNTSFLNHSVHIKKGGGIHSIFFFSDLHPCGLLDPRQPTWLCSLLYSRFLFFFLSFFLVFILFGLSSSICSLRKGLFAALGCDRAFLDPEEALDRLQDLVNQDHGNADVQHSLPLDPVERQNAEQRLEEGHVEDHEVQGHGEGDGADQHRVHGRRERQERGSRR
jgi:hypothetical protein